LKAGSLIQLLPDFTSNDVKIHAVYPTAQYLPSTLRSFVDHLLQTLKGGPEWDEC